MTATPEVPHEPLLCMSCGSDGIVLAYCAPVYVYAKSGHAERVVVADEEIEFKRRAWCRHCGEILTITNDEPDLGTWPAWEVGW